VSRPPEFFKPTSAGAWVGFGLFFLGMVVVFPWVLGLAIGMAAFYVVFFAIYRAMGRR
jgi:hypothetical protein